MAMAKNARGVWRNVLFLIGVGSVVALFAASDLSVGQLVEAVSHAGHYLVYAIVLWGGLYCLNALTWQTILQQSGRENPGFLYLLRLTISGFALNYVTPVGLLGGEPYRIMELSTKVGTERATSSVVLFSMMHIFSHFWYWLTAIVTFLCLVVADKAQTSTVVNFVMLGATMLSMLGIYFFCVGYRHGMVAAFFRFTAKIPGLRRRAAHFEKRNRARFEEIDAQIAALHSQNKRAFAASFLLEYVGRLLQSIEIMLFLLLMGQGSVATVSDALLLFIESFVVLAFASLLSNVLGFIPMQAGGREGGFALAAAHLGMTLSAGLSVSLFCRLREVVWIVIGLALMKLSPPAKVAESSVDAETRQ